MSLPIEVIEKSIFAYLKHSELIRISLNNRLSDIANSVIEKREVKCKYISNCLLHDFVLKKLLAFDISDICIFISFQVPKY